MVRRHLPRVARRPAHHGVLADQSLHHQRRARLEPRQLQTVPGELGVSHDHPPHRRNGLCRHGHGRDRGVPVRLLHGEDRPPQDANGPVRRGALATVGELPGPRVRMGADPEPSGAPQLEPRKARRRACRAALHELGRVHRLLLPMAAVHDHPGVRGARADPRLVPRGLVRSRSS